MERNYTPAQPNINIDSRPNVRVSAQKAPRMDGESFGATVSWPLAQAVAVGGAAFLMAYALLNYWSYGRVWVALSLSINFQFAALWGVCAGCGACIVFFMVNEIAFLLRTMAHWYAEHRNRAQDQQLVNTIYQLKNLCKVMETDIASLERDKARLEGQLRAQPQAQPQPIGDDRIASDETAEMHRRYLREHYSEPIRIESPAPDDHTARQMAAAMKLLKCNFDTGSIARDHVKPRMGMTTAEWELGRDFLMREGVVGQQPPRGYVVLDGVDAKDAIEALQRRIDSRAEAAAAGMVGA